MNKELRMFGFVPYNISEIQKGIQYGHAVVEYGLKYFNDDVYQEWAQYHKTFIILNGGSASKMESIVFDLESLGVKIATFREPDLNNMLSGICFILDERVFSNDIKYSPNALGVYDGNPFSIFDCQTEEELKYFQNLRAYIKQFKLA